LKANITSLWKKKGVRRIFLAGIVLFGLFILINDVLLPVYVNSGGVATIPSIVGMKYEDAFTVLDSLGFEPRKGDARLDKEHPAGIVIIQNPPAGSVVKSGRRIYLTVSAGEIQVPVPNLRGRTLRDSKFALERVGLKLGAVEYQQSEEYPPNTVMEQKISPGAKVKRDVYVSIVISTGSTADKIAVPDLTSKSINAAIEILKNVGLEIGNISYIISPDLLPNTIVDQYPRVGEMVGREQKIDLIVVREGELPKDYYEN
jgi:beta-lactam-binding protein with PASTA domain